MRTTPSIPEDAPPSFSSRSFHIDWTVTLWVSIPSWYPDIRQKVPIQVPAMQAAARTLPASQRRYSLGELYKLHGDFMLTCATDSHGQPIIPLGTDVPFSLTITPDEAATNQRIWVELMYTVNGAGELEKGKGARVACFESGWEAGKTISMTGNLSLPTSLPVSFDGKIMLIGWQLLIRREVPLQLDQVQTIPVTVVPKQPN